MQRWPNTPLTRSHALLRLTDDLTPVPRTAIGDRLTARRDPLSCGPAHEPPRAPRDWPRRNAILPGRLGPHPAAAPVELALNNSMSPLSVNGLGRFPSRLARGSSGRSLTFASNTWAADGMGRYRQAAVTARPRANPRAPPLTWTDVSLQSRAVAPGERGDLRSPGACCRRARRPGIRRAAAASDICSENDRLGRPSKVSSSC